ncbi:twin transmembrane helix small protein [Zooshikella sp. RANM57]|uniref:twin transmembrane helix small protein n=1 Tax=Zooshikella sp. RANM57 TaxID=3425863 RepID=UPI003D6E4392
MDNWFCLINIGCLGPLLMILKTVILILLAAVVVSLASGFYFLIHDRSKTNRLVNSLKVRVGLTLIILLLLAYGYYTGEFQPKSPWVYSLGE